MLQFKDDYEHFNQVHQNLHVTEPEFYGRYEDWTNTQLAFENHVLPVVLNLAETDFQDLSSQNCSTVVRLLYRILTGILSDTALYAETDHHLNTLCSSHVLIVLETFWHIRFSTLCINELQLTTPILLFMRDSIRDTVAPIIPFLDSIDKGAYKMIFAALAKILSDTRTNWGNSDLKHRLYQSGAWEMNNLWRLRLIRFQPVRLEFKRIHHFLTGLDVPTGGNPPRASDEKLIYQLKWVCSLRGKVGLLD